MTERYALLEIYEFALDAKHYLWGQAKAYGREPKVYLHWTAGHYNQHFDDYHISIDKDGRYVLATEDFSETLPHTWKRNTGAIGVTLECCAFATSNDLGDEPPTKRQIEAMARVITTLCHALDIPIDKEHVLTHGEAADNIDGIEPHEPYGCQNGCERWDLQFLETAESPSYTEDYDDLSTGGNVLRGKALWYAEHYPKGVWEQ